MNRMIIISLFVCSLFAAGCGFIFVARSQPTTPGYCYDCHRGARWHRVYTKCDNYEIMVVHDGYRYRPRHHAKHQEYKFVKYDHSRDKKEKEKESGEKKDKRSRR